ncbi:MAG TPA: 16S rRNA (guanine(527)-N(7))-methyltransferase RsmG [Rhodospirillales bacterium]|nr:16S rRNA (guanine(527)-N(7))-methyltransferase RsmG [Rhodospirillales bacterium]
MSPVPPEGPLDAEGFARLVPVSRETLARLEAHLALLARWQRRINLVGAASLADPWRRHILDSAQLLRLLPGTDLRLLDLGSGAGFPGLVLALLGVREVHLVESDRRKAAFLAEAVRLTGASGVTLHRRRIEALAPFPVEVVTARALAPLPRLLELAAPFLGSATLGLFPKGGNFEAELTEARRHWRMRTQIEPSLSSPEGRILVLREVRRVRSSRA